MGLFRSIASNEKQIVLADDASKKWAAPALTNDFETPQSAPWDGVGGGVRRPGLGRHRIALRMSHSAYPAVYPRRRRWPLFLPFALVVLLAVAWSILWFYAANRHEVEIAAWRARELQAGR